MKPHGTLICLIALLLVLNHTTIVFGYGDDSGGSDDGDDKSFATTAAGGGVSWGENPNGAGVMGSSIWDGRSENLHHGPYQPDTAVEDAEAALFQGLDQGQYNEEQVREQLGWAQSVGIKLSEQAQNFLDGVTNQSSADGAGANAATDPSASTPPTSPGEPSKTDKQNEAAAAILNGLQDGIQLLREGKSGEEIEKFIDSKVKTYEAGKTSKTTGKQKKNQEDQVSPVWAESIILNFLFEGDLHLYLFW